MLRYSIIRCRSLTYAQRASRILERSGLFAVVAKIPQELSHGGCGYGVKIRADQRERAMKVLEKAEIEISGFVGVEDTGRTFEVK